MTTHACPSDGTGVMPCCGKTPLEALGLDRMTVDQRLVTCGVASPRDRAAREVRTLILASGGLGVCTADVLALPTIAEALDALDERIAR